MEDERKKQIISDTEASRELRRLSVEPGIDDPRTPSEILAALGGTGLKPPVLTELPKSNADSPYLAF